MRFVPTNWPEERRILRNRVGFTLVLVFFYHFGFFAQTVPGGALWFFVLASVQLIVNGIGVARRWNTLPTFNFFYDQLNAVVLIGLSGGAGSVTAFIVAMLLISELLWFAQVRLVPWLTLLQVANLLAGTLLANALGLETSWRALVALTVGLAIMARYLVKPISQLQQDALIDPLTGTLNRRTGIKTLSTWVQDKLPFQLVFVDLRGFKEINDTHGHRIGDELLEAVAGRLRSSVRDDDLVVRYGGDEFLLGVRGTDDLPERVKQLLRSKYRTSAGTLLMDIDVGSASYPDEASGLSGLIGLADSRMYKHKHGSARGSLVKLLEAR